MQTLKRRALVVEDEALMASLISSALEKADFKVVTSANVVEARKAIEKFDPDVALIDISLGDGPTGIDLAKIIRQTRPDIGVLILTRHPDSRTAGAAENIPEGCGFLRKETVGDTQHLLRSIESVLSDSSSSVRQDLDPDRPLARLTTKQIELLRMVAQGLTNSQISLNLQISSSAVEQRLGLIFKNLDVADIDGVSPRAEAMRIFITHAGLPERD